MENSLSDAELIRLTASLVTAHVSNNPVATGDLAGLLRSVHGAFGSMTAPVAEAPPETRQTLIGRYVDLLAADADAAGENFTATAEETFTEPVQPPPFPEPVEEPEPVEAGPKPIVPVEESVTPDRIICLECGRSMRVLKSHLNHVHDMPAEEYRAKWGLPDDYPRIAENTRLEYAERAKSSTGNLEKARAANRRKFEERQAAKAPVPAFNPEKSVRDDSIVCLDCGKPFLVLTTHIMKSHHTNPDAYRAKWGLPDNYPMTANDYSLRMMEHARRRGMGTEIRRGGHKGELELTEEVPERNPRMALLAVPQ